LRCSHFRLVLIFAFVAACGSSDSGDKSINVTWTFASGDCASSGVDTVQVTWGLQGGATQNKDFACLDGGGNLGEWTNRGTYSIAALGFDAGGVARVETWGISATFSGSGVPGGSSINMTLHPKAADLTVTWSFSDGSTCPPGVILPYAVTLYQAPAEVGGPLTKAEESDSAGCSSGLVTLTHVTPGDYLVVVDSRAISPAVKATASVTVKPGENAQVAVKL
jgi:hypothetical protein